MTIWALIPLATCLTYIALLILTLSSLERRINKVFAFYLGVSAAWSFTSFMLHINAVPQQALFWNELLVIFLIWTLITYYHFTRAYVNQPAGKGVFWGYVYLAIMAAFILSGRIIQYAYVIDGVLFHSLGNSLYLIGAICATFIGAVIVLLVRKYRSSLDPIDRNRTAYLMTAWGIIVLGAYTNNFIPALDALPLDHIASLANALIIAYAIQKYQLLDIKRLFRKGLVYSSLTVSLTAMYLLLLLVLQMFFQDWLGYTSLALAAGTAVLVAVFFNPLRNVIQNWIDRVFYRETYDYRQMLLHFSGKISNVLDLGELAQSILTPLVDAMHVSKAALLFPKVGSGDFNTRFNRQATKEAKGESFNRLRLLQHNPIVKWLATEGKTLRSKLIDTIPELKGLWEVERIALNALGIELLCPIRSKGELIGILALGRKQSDTPYTNEEVDLLMTMANEAAVAVENASMLDSLKSQQLQVEQLLAQVVLAQEDERNRISIDLHDSVAQWLVAASYRLQTFSQGLSETKDTKAQNELADMEDTLSKSLKELRRVVIGLRPVALDELGLTHALRQGLDELKPDGLICNYKELGTPVRLPPNMEIAVYRIVQEALANIRKHAQASRVGLRVQFQKNNFSVEIRDNGRGFDLSQTLDSAIAVGHIGLLGMKQRVEMLGGDIKIRTGEEAGTTVTLNFPLPTKVESR